MTTTVVTSGNTANGTVLNNGDILNVEVGGSATNTIINSGGLENVDGSVTGTTVNIGGTEALYTGTSSGTLVNGGTQLVHSGASASGTVVNSGGSVAVDGTVTATAVNNGGTVTLYNGATASDTMINSGGSEIVSSGATVSSTTIAASGTLFLRSGATATNGITFNGSGGVLDISGTTMPTTIISGFAATDRIDLDNLTYASSNTISVSGDAVTVTDSGGVSDTLSIIGASNYQFGLSAEPNGTGGTELKISSASGNPIVSSPTVTVAENAAATAIGIAAPTDPNYTADQLTIAAGTLPADGTVTLADGTTAVTAGQALTSAQLTGLLFTPAAGQFSASSAFTYTVTDPASNAATGIATLAIGPAAPAFTTPSEIVNNASTVIAGTAEAGSTVTLFSGGAVIGGATADATTGIFAVTPSTPLALGLNTLSATVTTASGTSASSAMISVFDVQAPVDGISTTDFSSADLGAVLGQGAQLAFINGTESVLLTDSTLSVGPDTNQATIQRLYEGLLGRGNDTGGISVLDAQLTSGMSKAAVANEFLNSNEYTAGHGTQTDDQLISSLYQGFLGRAPDPDGGAYWTGVLAQGEPREDVVISFADCDEAKTYLAPTTTQIYVPNAAGTLAHELYETGLGREVELAALPNFKAAYVDLTPAQLAANIVGSAEFMNDHAGQSNSDYVNSLYQDGLGRAPEAAGSAYWTGQLDSGSASRSDLLLSFATSTEGAAHLTHNLGA